MKNLKKYSSIFLALGLFLQTAVTCAQSANTNQIGIRLGGFSGISFRHLGSESFGVEADMAAGYHSDWVMLEVLAEKQIPLNYGFTFDFGAGGFFADDHNYPHNEDPYDWRPTIGITGMIGFDYYFSDVPLNIGLDVRPRFSFIEEPYWPWDAALSLHYIF